MRRLRRNRPTARAAASAGPHISRKRNVNHGGHDVDRVFTGSARSFASRVVEGLAPLGAQGIGQLRIRDEEGGQARYQRRRVNEEGLRGQGRFARQGRIPNRSEVGARQPGQAVTAEVGGEALARENTHRANSEQAYRGARQGLGSEGAESDHEGKVDRRRRVDEEPPDIATGATEGRGREPSQPTVSR